MPLKNGEDRDLRNFHDYPIEVLQKDLFTPPLDVDWKRITWQLDTLRIQLAIQEDKIRSSDLFGEKNPPQSFRSSRTQLSALYTSLRNLYGMAKPSNSAEDSIKAAEVFLNKALNFREGLDGESRSVGFIHFCIAAAKGYVGIAQFGSEPTDEFKLQMLKDAREEIEEAEKLGWEPAVQYHLKAALFMSNKQYAQAAEAWGKAAERWPASDPKMHFNRACALAVTGDYVTCLSELGQAIAIYDRRSLSGQPSAFDPRAAALDDMVGAEFKPFRSNPPERSAAAARWVGKSFDDLTKRAGT